GANPKNSVICRPGHPVRLLEFLETFLRYPPGFVYLKSKWGNYFVLWEINFVFKGRICPDLPWISNTCAVTLWHGSL
ncbi:MAG: hypothetical protein ACTSU9_18605, partial [Promethearchaeota archaeon]